MNNIRKIGAYLGAGAVIFSLAGCADKNGNGQAESPADANNVEGAVKDNIADTGNAISSGVGAAGDAAKGAAGAVGDAASGAAGAASNAASGAAAAASGAAASAGNALANAGEAAKMTPAVKTALAGNAGLKGLNINVDTLGAKDSIALRGKVKSAGQKKLAESIAKKAAPGYKIINQLTTG